MARFPYSRVESSWLREQLAETPWTERPRIDDLVRLDHYIRHGIHQSLSGMHYRMLLDRYPEESLILLREFSEDRYQAEVQHRRERQRRHESWMQAQQDDEAALHEDWLRAGGRP
jgi:hypothetical protein